MPDANSSVLPNATRHAAATATAATDATAASSVSPGTRSKDYARTPPVPSGPESSCAAHPVGSGASVLLPGPPRAVQALVPAGFAAAAARPAEAIPE